MKNICIAMMILTFSYSAFSQSATKVTRADIENEKKVYLTNELKLSDDQTDAFWTVYEAYEKESNALTNKQRKIKRALRNIEVLSEEEQYSLTRQSLQIQKQKAEVKIKYLEKFSAKIGKKKAAAVFKAEDDFKRLLFKRIKKMPRPPDAPDRE